MKTPPSRVFENTFILVLVLVFSAFALRRATPSLIPRTPPGLTRIQGTASYYAYSDGNATLREGLPVILCIGHSFEGPDVLARWVGQFDEPVLLIWSDLLSDLSGDTRVDDWAVWEKKRQEFATRFARYQAIFRFNGNRVYLTGFSFAGAYAWMLAYDRPELYAGVVAMSAVSHPRQIQQRLKNGVSVVTVVVRGEEDRMFPERLADERRTGQTIESHNPHSSFIIKQGESHSGVAKYWVENLKYVLQFRKESNR